MEAELIRDSLAELDAHASNGASDKDLYAMRYQVGHILDQNPDLQDQTLGLFLRVHRRFVKFFYVVSRASK